MMEFELAFQCSIDKYEDLAQEFLNEIFGIEGALVTDESTLTDFDFELTGETVEHHTQDTLDKIEEVYGIDVSDIEGLVLWKILERIDERQKSRSKTST